MSHFKVFIRVNSPVGIFTGFASEALQEDAAFEERNHVQEVLRDCSSFTFFSEEEGTEVTLPRGTIESSVFELTVMRFDA